ncbi:MAG: type II toxin-antitoxin system PemK/MazF family toxin [Acaryochloridaceae cyanobacterium RU_4_10]|nr:type II toxin-antitoxin system PemK/MazF family toxin [Acaryochloridaceae cyanobacterium RU_4_10]
MKVNQRDIVLINFPFSDLSGAKVRPALVISNQTYNVKNLDTVVLALTSNLSASDYKIFVSNQDLESGQLPVKSAIRADKPFSVLQSKILKVQAKILVVKFDEVQTAIAQLIDG